MRHNNFPKWRSKFGELKRRVCWESPVLSEDFQFAFLTFLWISLEDHHHLAYELQARYIVADTWSGLFSQAEGPGKQCWRAGGRLNPFPPHHCHEWTQPSPQVALRFLYSTYRIFPFLVCVATWEGNNPCPSAWFMPYVDAIFFFQNVAFRLYRRFGPVYVGPRE